ncbi:tetratricopeptide repeat protein [Pseudodesulfovibrio sp.]|uniref:tetratricopeptide repeat protein n=1 Tax=Pseudodesulfovibrio sp. TaxID=2035812 RepID=UPI00260D84BE|nr:tetratricopeptide repeat protein [Pseudodesulfovibrio sp.]MDD3313821.1 tetratricopeptide repeat protein [Pseudodesulfovibrio sp.]
MNGECEVMGVYSHSTRYEYRPGDEGSRYLNSTFWFVRKRDDEVYEVRPLDGDHIPSGVVRLVPKADFLKYYTPELSYYQTHPLPCLLSLQEKVRGGRRLFNADRLDKAERAFIDAVMAPDREAGEADELAEVYADQRHFTRLRDMVERLLNTDEEFREAERHRFNEFGIDLRKQSRYDDSIRYYTKALEVNESDENLHFNIARAYHGKGRFDDCRRHLERALALNPDMEEAKGFLRALDVEQAERDIRAGRPVRSTGRKPAPAGSKMYDLKF